MKARALVFVALLLGAGIAVGIVYFRKSPKVPGYAIRGTVIHKWLTAYALDHNGGFPPDLSELTKKSYGADALYLSDVVEYRGAGLTMKDDPNLLILRCRVEGHPEWEVQVLLSGGAFSRPAKTSS